MSVGPCESACRVLTGSVLFLEVLGSIALSITILALPTISFLILPLAIGTASLAIVGAVINSGCGPGSTGEKTGLLFIAFLKAGLLIGLFFVAPIAVPIIILSGAAFGCYCGSSSISSGTSSLLAAR